MRSLKDRGVGELISNFSHYIKGKIINPPYPTRYKRIVVFGDELSDIGRWGLLTKGEFPPGKLGFYKGRWTNGRVWVEVLAEQMGINTPTLDNYAQAGATSGLENIFSPLKKLLKIDKSITLDGMLGQINRYVASKPKTNDSTLYILMAGSNDIKNYLVNGSPNIDENTIANNISSGVQLLANIGASHFLLVNQIDLVNAPGFSSEKRSNTIVELCTLTNNALKVLVEEYNKSDLTIKCFDIADLFLKVSNEPEYYGFSYYDAFLPLNSINMEHPINGDELPAHHQEKGMLPDQFIFWWSACPSAAMHRIMGEHAVKYFEKKEI